MYGSVQNGNLVVFSKKNYFLSYSTQNYQNPVMTMIMIKLFKAHHIKCANDLRIKCFYFKLKAAEHVDMARIFEKSWQSFPCFVIVFCCCCYWLLFNHVISMAFFILRCVELKCLTLKPCAIFPKNILLWDDASNRLR